MLVMTLSRTVEGWLATTRVGRLATGFARTVAFGLDLGPAAGSTAGPVTNLRDRLLVGFDLGPGFSLAFAPHCNQRRH